MCRSETAIQSSDAYCNTEQLTINYDKSKVLVFTWKRGKHRWQINGHLTEQVKIKKYLGIIFQATGSWKTEVQ